MPGFFALPVIKILTFLIPVRLTKASVPMYAELTLAFTNCEASPRVNPTNTILPISGILMDPSPVIGKSSIKSFWPFNWMLIMSPTSNVYDESGFGSLIGINDVWNVEKKSLPKSSSSELMFRVSPPSNLFSSSIKSASILALRFINSSALSNLLDWDDL